MTVQASAPLVRTRESELSSIIDAKQVDALPTNGRNFLSLLQTSGSVVPTGSGSGALSVNGQGTRMANFLADGVSMTGREIRTLNGEFGGGNGLSLDVVKELQVITNGFKAETGQTGAGTISVITKSGTNTLSGSAYGFWRPTDFVAANLLNGAATTQSRSQYGGTIGGPIKKDVTHYFANYEDTTINDASVVTSVLGPGTFPAPQTQRQGFFKVDHRFSDHNALDVRYNFNRNTQEAQSVGGLNTYRPPHQHGRADRRLRRLAPQQLRLEQSERGAVPLHLRYRRLLLAADGVERCGVENARLLVRPGFGRLHRRRQRRDQPVVPAEPGREAGAVGRSVLGRPRRASVQERRRRHRVVALRHALQQLPRHLHVRAGGEIPLQRERPGDLSDPVHPDVRHFRAELQGRDGWPVHAGRLGSSPRPDAEPRRALGQGFAVPGRQQQLRAARRLRLEP